MLHDHAAYPAVAGSVAQARHFVELRLTVMGCSESSVRDAALLVSELAANVVRHARTPFSVALHQDDDTINVEVADTGTGDVHPRQPDLHGGRGLMIVDAIAQDWGVRRQLDGKAVFFTVPC
jgi:anti-sigma regulatory factor (Ser/Thr protein kinase)